MAAVSAAAVARTTGSAIEQADLDAATLAGDAGATDAALERIELSANPLPNIELAPFTVKGEELSVSVYARTRSDRRYAERFAESVVEIAYETMGKSTGHGLVIVGDKKEPHPLSVFDQFLEMAEEKQVDGDMAEAAKELEEMLKEWEAKAQMDGGDATMDIDFNVIIDAIPMPLEGIASKLYLVAWSEDFDEKRVEERLSSLSAADFEKGEFAKYDWVFYLPPRNAFKKVLKEILPVAMEEAELGMVKRMAVRGAIFTFKPLIKDAIEGLRKGMLYLTVMRAKSGYDQGEIEALMTAYIGALMPHGKIIPGKKRERALEAIAAQKIENAEYAKDPFVSPTPLERPDLTLYSRFEGEYGPKNKTTHRFTLKDNTCYWQYSDWEPGVFLPAGDALFVSEKGDMTIEFVVDDNGVVTGIEERWDRRKNWVPAERSQPIEAAHRPIAQ